jgi:hypothetical protein
MMLADAVNVLILWGQELEEATGVPPGVLAAAAVLIVGIIVGVLLSKFARRLVARLASALPERGREPALGDVVGRRSTAAVAGRIIFWLTIVLASIAAIEVLGLPVVTAWPEEIAAYLPRVVAAVLVVVVGVVVGRVTRSAVSRVVPSTMAVGPARLAALVEIAVIGAAGLVAVEQLGIATSFITTLVLLVLGAMLASAALAFGLGGRQMVAQILAAHYVRELYDLGEHVRVDGVEGRIVRITQGGVILDSDEGRVVVPASTFATHHSIRIVQEP